MVTSVQSGLQVYSGLQQPGLRRPVRFTANQLRLQRSCLQQFSRVFKSSQVYNSLVGGLQQSSRGVTTVWSCLRRSGLQVCMDIHTEYTYARAHSCIRTRVHACFTCGNIHDRDLTGGRGGERDKVTYQQILYVPNQRCF